MPKYGQFSKGKMTEFSLKNYDKFCNPILSFFMHHFSSSLMLSTFPSNDDFSLPLLLLLCTDHHNNIIGKKNSKKRLEKSKFLANDVLQITAATKSFYLWSRHGADHGAV